MKPNLNIDVTDPSVQAEAGSVNEKTGGATGKHIVTIKQASVSYTGNGAAKIQIVLESEAGKTWKLPEQFLTSGQDKDFAPLHYKKVVSNMLILTNSSGTVSDGKIKVTRFVDGKPIDAEEIVDSYNDLVGKKIGVVMKYYQAYPESLAINGYTNRPIPERLSDKQGYEAAKSLPTTIWMPNYEKDAKPVFDVVMYFDPSTGKTLSELQDDECDEPTKVNEALEKLKKHDPAPRKLDNAKWDALRIKKLQYNLGRNGMEYDASKFIASQGIDKNDVDEVSYDEVSYDDAE